STLYVQASPRHVSDSIASANIGRSVSAAWCIQPFIPRVPPAAPPPPGPHRASPHMVAKETLSGDAHGVGARPRCSLASSGHASRPEAPLFCVGLPAGAGPTSPAAAYARVGHAERRLAGAGPYDSRFSTALRPRADIRGQKIALRSVRASRVIRPEKMLDYCS